MKNKRGGIAGDILLYILATIMFVFVGYIVAGAYGGWEGAPENFMDRIMFILDNIDVLQVNEFTVLFVTIGFMFPQLIMGIILYSKISSQADRGLESSSKRAMKKIEENKEEEMGYDLPTEVVDDTVTNDKVSDDFEKSEEEVKERNQQTIEEESVPEGDETVKQKEEKKDDIFSVIKRSSQDEEDVGFDQATSLKMLNIGFSMEQIRAMMELKEYVNDVDADFLSKVFKKNMSPSMIHERIEAFYG